MVGCRTDGGLLQLPSVRNHGEEPREGRVPSVYTSNCEGVLFTHELVGALLPFLGKVETGGMVAVKALMSSAVEATEDSEGEVSVRYMPSPR